MGVTVFFYLFFFHTHKKGLIFYFISLSFNTFTVFNLSMALKRSDKRDADKEDNVPRHDEEDEEEEEDDDEDIVNTQSKTFFFITNIFIIYL